MTLTFLSWNLAMLDTSAQAPLGWGQHHTEAAVRELALALAPDVILFQELPRLVPFVETHEMVPVNPRSHNGNLATLVRRELVATKPNAQVVNGCGLLLTFPHLDLTIANVHLAPGKGAGDERLVQLAQIAEQCPTTNLAVIGDTNTRLDEAEQLALLGLSGDKPPSPTWDSRRNRFHTEIPEFSAYFTRWFLGGNLTVTNAKVWNTPIERDGESFFLSDHYALSGTITLHEATPAVTDRLGE